MTPETQPHDYDADEQYITQLAKECGTVINGMYQYYNHQSMMHQPEIALFAAIEAIGVVCGRIWEADAIYPKRGNATYTIPPTTTTDYLTILAKTGAGKETAKQMICEFLESVDIPTPAGATTAGSIHKEAQKHPRTVIITDEAGLNRQIIGSGKGDPYGKKTVETYLMDIYSGRWKATKPPQVYADSRDNPQLKTIQRNALSCILLSTPETYYKALDPDDAHSGYLSRHGVILSTRNRVPELGTPVTDPEEITAAKRFTEALIKPFKDWLPYHAGAPDCDTYDQLIPPSMATAWEITNDQMIRPAVRETAEKMRYPPHRQKWEAWEPTGTIMAKPQRVIWEPEAQAELMKIYADNEADSVENPETADLRNRKMQHIMIYAMRIALANDLIWNPPADTRKQPNPPRIDENPKAGQYMANERKRYDGLTSLWEIKIIADADAPARNEIFDEYKNAKAEADNYERRRKEGEEPTPEEKKAREREATARNQYKAKIHAVEMACQRVYYDNPPVISLQHVNTARKFIEFAANSAIPHLIDAIPKQTWYDCKEAIRTILRKAPDHKMAKSRIEERIKRFSILGDKLTQLLKEMETDGEIRIDTCYGGATICLIDTPQPEQEVPITSGNFR